MWQRFQRFPRYSQIGCLLCEGGRGDLIQVFTGGGGFDSCGEFRRCGIGGLGILGEKKGKFTTGLRILRIIFSRQNFQSLIVFIYGNKLESCFWGCSFFLDFCHIYGIYVQNWFLSLGALAVIVLLSWLSLLQKVRVCYGRASVVQLPFKSSFAFQEKLFWNVRM